jgi:hypothetical protein
VLSDIYLSSGQPEDGVQPLLRVVRIDETLSEALPDRYRPDLAAALHSLANIQAATGRREEAVASCQRGRDIYEQLACQDPDEYLARFAGSLRMLRGHLMSAGLLEHALPIGRQQVEVMCRLVAKDRGFRGLLAESYHSVALMLILAGDIADAQKMEALSQKHLRLAADEQAEVDLRVASLASEADRQFCASRADIHIDWKRAERRILCVTSRSERSISRDHAQVDGRRRDSHTGSFAVSCRIRRTRALLSKITLR